MKIQTNSEVNLIAVNWQIKKQMKQKIKFAFKIQ